MGFWTSLIAAAAAALALQAPAKISGPIPITKAGGAVFTGGSGTEAPAGYVQAEYFVSGVVDGKPYKTTLLVRRPADPRRFSGLVLVEPVHIGGSSVLWQYHDVLEDGGHGFALVGAQRGALELTIRPANKTRYADLRIPEGPADDGKGLSGVLANAPPELAKLLRSSETEAPIAHEIMSQVGAALKAGGTESPFPGRVRWLITGGYSQTGQLTLKYLRGPSDRAGVYDGFFPAGSVGGDVPVPPHKGKVIHILGEGDYLNFGSKPAYRRADSDAAGDRYRLYEIAGASHNSTRGTQPPAGVYEPGEQPSPFPHRMIYAAALQNLIDWVMKGTPPPRATRLALRPDGSIARDSHGNAVGGLRTNLLDVPTSRIVAAAPPASSKPGFNRHFYGLAIPLPRDELQRLYPTQEAYVSKAKIRIDEMVRGRWLRAQDARDLKAEAERAAIP